MNVMTKQLAFDYIEGIPLSFQNSSFFGHDSVVCFLRQTLKKRRLHHALLFKGSQGIGKATLAFHLAWNILKDVEQDFMHPDDSSLIWKKIGQNVHPSLLYISRGYDVKTQKFRTSITIGDIQRIAGFLQKTQFDNNSRIVIIDSVDDMNHNAANALLKTLEEPPTKTQFVLVSHNPSRLLPTIRSRCQMVIFKPLKSIEVYRALSYIAAPIGFDPAKPLAEILIKRSEGSIRKAVLILISDGLEIASIIDDILSISIFPVSDIHHLASIINGRNSERQFHFFLDYLANIIAKGARKNAFIGNLAKAEQFAQFWQIMQQDIAESLNYNLNKKQLIIVMMQKVHGFLHNDF
ncbi:MAG: DNA polymerase III subunit gamma/tau [Candidatus Tokpelaia sp. JSC188]|nr:MAG: DNA polymerase III subunit gamma/tau [Candidatus Tokpelaia sp. JSC188]